MSCGKAARGRVAGSDRTIDGRSAGQAQADAARAEIRRLIAMSDREREAHFLESNRKMLRMLADAQRSE